MQEFKQAVMELVSKEIPLEKQLILELIEVPPQKEFGDYAFPCFSLAKTMKKSPMLIAKELEEKIQSKLNDNRFVSKAQAVQSYVNFFINETALAEITLKQVFEKKENYGKVVNNNKTIVIDFSSPNIAKPFSIGHLRSTVIGNSLKKIYESQGYKAIGINHLGDWGTQFGKLIIAYKKWGNKKELEENPIEHLLEIYVKFHSEAEQKPELEEEARNAFRELEKGNKEHNELWKHFSDLSLKEFDKIYSLMKIKFDSVKGESAYRKEGLKLIEELKKKKIAVESKGAIVIDLEKYNLPPLLLQKSDETTLYATRDLTAAIYRNKTYKPEKIFYVVGSEQSLHFQQLKKAFGEIGEKELSEKIEHVQFGLYKFAEGKMSTRKGKVIFLEDVFEKAIELVGKQIEEKNPELKNKEETAKILGVGAIIFGDLINDRINDISFDWEKILQLQGETCPYVEYTHARIKSILRKSREKISAKIDYSQLREKTEKEIISLIAGFEETVQQALKQNKPSIIAKYLIELCQSYNSFYNAIQVLSEENSDKRKARLLLCDCACQVIKNSLSLLGIQTVEEM